MSLLIARRSAVLSAAAALLASDVGRFDGAVTLPIETDSGHVLIPLRVNDAPPEPFVVDTGAGLTILDEAFAERIGAVRRGVVEMTGLSGGQVEAGLLEDLRLESGALSFSGKPALAISIPNHLLDRGDRRRIAGILGCPSFADLILRIDMHGQTLTFLPPGAPPHPAGRHIPLGVEPLGIDPHRPGIRSMTVPVTLDGTATTFRFDTGLGSADVLLSLDYARARGMPGCYPRHIAFTSPGGVDGAVREFAAIARSLTVGEQPLPPPMVTAQAEAVPWRGPIDLARIWRSWFGPKPASGLIGLGPFLPAVLFIDPVGRRLVLEPSNAPPPASRSLISTGVCVDKPERDHFTVLSLIDGSPACKSGLSAGDRIVAVNDRPARSLSLTDFGRLNRRMDQAAALLLDTGRRISVPAGPLLP